MVTLLCACGEQSRAQGLAQLSARGRRRSRRVCPELLCPLRLGGGSGSRAEHAVCPGTSELASPGEAEGGSQHAGVGKQPRPAWIRVSCHGGGIPGVAGLQSIGVWQRGQRDLGAKDPEAGSAGISIRAGILACFSAWVPLIIHPSPIPSVLSPPAGVWMAGMPGIASACSECRLA